MHFFFDESGDFSPPQDAREHKVSVAVGLAVSDVVRDQFAERFSIFENTRSTSERNNGEIKGRLLSNESRNEFCELLASLDGISITPATLDLSSLTEPYCDQLPATMGRLLEQHAESMVYASGREGLRLIARQFANLSTTQALRIYTWAVCIREAVEHALIFLSTGDHANSWLTPRFELDRVQMRAGSREERVSSVLIFAWLWGWSTRRPFSLVQEIHTPDHPFVREYDNGEVIDVSKLIRRNLYWVNSLESWGVRAADIAANIVFNAVVDLDDRNGNASLYASLMRSSFYGPMRGPGLFTPMPDVPGEVSGKYMLLSEVMKRP